MQQVNNYNHRSNNYPNNQHPNNNRPRNGRPNGGFYQPNRGNGPQNGHPNSRLPLMHGYPVPPPIAPPPHVIDQFVHHQRQQHMQMQQHLQMQQQVPPNMPPQQMFPPPPPPMQCNQMGYQNGPPPSQHQQTMHRFAGPVIRASDVSGNVMVPHNQNPATIEKERYSIESRESGFEEPEVFLIADGIVQTPDGIVRFRHLGGNAFEIIPEVGGTFVAFDNPVAAVEKMYTNGKESVRKQLAHSQEQVERVTNELRNRADAHILTLTQLEDLEREKHTWSLQKEQMSLTIAKLTDESFRLTHERNDLHKEIERMQARIEHLKMDNKELTEENANMKNAVSTETTPIQDKCESQPEEKEVEKKDVVKTIQLQEDPLKALRLQAEKEEQEKLLLKKQAEDNKKAELLNRQRKSREVAESRARAKEMKRQQAEESRRRNIERAAEQAAKKAEEKRRADEEAAMQKVEKERLEAEKKEAKAQRKLRKKAEQKEKKVAQAEKEEEEKTKTEKYLKSYKTEVDNEYYKQWNLQLPKEVTHGDDVQSSSDGPSTSDKSQKPGAPGETTLPEETLVEPQWEVVVEQEAEEGSEEENPAAEDDEDLSSEIEEPSLNAENEEDEDSGSPERRLGRNLQLFNMNGMVPKDV